MHFSKFPEPAVWLEPRSVSCLWAEKCNIFCILPSRSLLCPAFWDPSAPPWSHLCGSFPIHRNSLPLSQLPPSLRAKAPILKFSSSFQRTSLLFSYLYPLSYLVPGSLACAPHPSPQRPGIFCCCFLAVVPYLDELFMYLWGGWPSPCLTPLPSSSASQHSTY